MNDISLDESQDPNYQEQFGDSSSKLEIELKNIGPFDFQDSSDIQIDKVRSSEVLQTISEMQLNVGYASEILILHQRELSQLSSEQFISEVVMRVIAKEQEMATEEFIQSEQLGINLQISQFWSDSSKDKQGPKLYVSKKQFEWKQQQDDEPRFECGICYEAKPIQLVQKLETVPCKDHQFCLECIKSYISNATRSSQIIKICCPQVGCDVEYDENYIATLLTEKGFQNYQKFKKIYIISQNPNVRWCPKIDCTSYVVGPPLLNTKLLTCECGQVICYDCGHPDHSGQNCEQAIDYTYKEAMKKYTIHSCPKCLAPIQKASGCNHINCVKCKYNFCWLCRRTYTNGHYGNSLFACHGKQFSDDKPAKHPYLLLFLLVFIRLIFYFFHFIYKSILFMIFHLSVAIIILISLPRNHILNFFPTAQVVILLKNPRWQYFLIQAGLILIGIILMPLTITLMIFPGSCIMIYRRFK